MALTRKCTEGFMNCIAIKNQCQNALGSLYEGNDYNFLHWKTFAIEVCHTIYTRNNMGQKCEGN